MVVDIGGGTTDVAVISLAGVVYSKSVRVAGDEMDEAIIRFIKTKYNLLIGERTAEQIKIQVGSAYPLEEPVEIEIRGRNLMQGVPQCIKINDTEIRRHYQIASASSFMPSAQHWKGSHPNYPLIWSRGVSSWQVEEPFSRIWTRSLAKRPNYP